jgi:hypothetical protein
MQKSEPAGVAVPAWQVLQEVDPAALVWWPAGQAAQAAAPAAAKEPAAHLPVHAV